MAGATLFLEPRGIQPGHLSQVALPTVLVLGKLGLAVLLVGFFAATCGAALETDPITVTEYSVVLSAAASGPGWRPGPATTSSASCPEPGMRLTELLGAEVVDQAGKRAGRVHDVRLVQDGRCRCGCCSAGCTMTAAASNGSGSSGSSPAGS